MDQRKGRSFVDKDLRGFEVARVSEIEPVSADPELQARLLADLQAAKERSGSPFADVFGIKKFPRMLGFDDGVILPPDKFPVGTPRSIISSAAADRAPLRGTVRVVVVLVQFSDRAMGQTAAHLSELFFSTGVMAHGSVREYYKEVSGGLVDIEGQVVGPYTLPQTLAWYANNNFGIGRPSGQARANIMARDAAVAANPSVDFGLYDNDGNGFVDAFIVVHAGRGGEQTGNSNDIWSHKWTLPSAYGADGKQIFAYLTIPEDARLGVCAHELGHLLFGFPDLYDTDGTSEGVGNWCLMAGGSWNGGGEIPAHPSAWCKAQQGWAGVSNVTTNGVISIPDVKTSRNVHRLWKDGAGGSEYFLLENRQRTGSDAGLPGDGLLIWHIDETQAGNTDENHYKVALEQADGKRDLELRHNRGDAGDPYPGTSGNASYNANSTPNSNSYAGQATAVSVTGISPSGPTMSATIQVHAKSVMKDAKDRKDHIKDHKESSKDLKDRIKDRKELKESSKDLKDRIKDRKELKEFKESSKDLKDRVEGKARGKDLAERPNWPNWPDRAGPASSQSGGPSESNEALAELEARVAQLETVLGVGGEAEAFIGTELRPDLLGGPSYAANGDLQQRMVTGDRDAKVAFDTLPSR